jgi:c-di-GMP-binding flagellar brake protein YcgR
MSGGADRRRFPRKDRKFSVKYRAIGGAHHRDIADRMGMVINISRGGMVLTSKREFPVDTLFTIHIPETPLGPARDVKGKVVWARAAADSGDYHVGCMFVRIVESDPQERRQFERKPVKLPLSLRAADGEGESVEGQLQDLSQGGIEFRAPRSFDKAALVMVGFPSSPLGGSRTVFVEILRSKAEDEKGWFRIAGRFVDAK